MSTKNAKQLKDKEEVLKKDAPDTDVIVSAGHSDTDLLGLKESKSGFYADGEEDSALVMDEVSSGEKINDDESDKEEEKEITLKEEAEMEESDESEEIESSEVETIDDDDEEEESGHYLFGNNEEVEEEEESSDEFDDEDSEESPDNSSDDFEEEEEEDEDEDEYPEYNDTSEYEDEVKESEIAFFDDVNQPKSSEGDLLKATVSSATFNVHKDDRKSIPKFINIETLPVGQEEHVQNFKDPTSKESREKKEKVKGQNSKILKSKQGSSSEGSSNKKKSHRRSRHHNHKRGVDINITFNINPSSKESCVTSSRHSETLDSKNVNSDPFDATWHEFRGDAVSERKGLRTETWFYGIAFTILYALMLAIFFPKIKHLIMSNKTASFDSEDLTDYFETSPDGVKCKI